MSVATISKVQTQQGTDKKALMAIAFSRWSNRYREDVMVMSQAKYGNYMQQFISYVLGEPDILITERDRAKAQARLEGELTEMARGFEVESRYSDSKINETWLRHFVVFCMTGDIHSSYNIFDYLDTNENGRLPSNVWDRKEIPSAIARKGSSNDDLRKRVEALESQVATLSRKKMEPHEESSETISGMFSDYVRLQMNERGTNRESVLRSLIDLMNEDCEDFVRIELELILDRINASSYCGQVRAILERLIEMGVFLKKDSKPYLMPELLSKPLGFELIKENNQKPLRSR